MKKLLMYCCLAGFAGNMNSQKVIDVDKDAGTAMGMGNMFTVAGNPFVNAKFARVVDGSPFFNEQMMKGAIILSEGREYRNILVRINLLDVQVNYIGEKQIELVASTPIREVVLWDTIYNKDFRFVSHNYIDANEKPEKDFYELLQAGKAELYKQHKKQLLETKPYGSATVEQKIQTDIFYFVLKDKHWKKIKRLKDLTAILNDKATDIAKFISEKKITGDNESSFESVIAHYNSLFIQQ